MDKYNKMVSLGQNTELTPGQLKWLPYGSRYHAYYEERLKGRSAAFNSDL